MLLTYKYRIYPSNKQKNKALKQFNICKEIYNELLYQNQEYLINKKYEFNSIVKDIKITCPNYYSQVHSQVLQNISDRVTKALENFFRRVKEKKIKPGFPRFKSKIKSITYPQSGFKIDKRLYVSKIGYIPIKFHRNLKGKVKTLTIKYNNANQWFACFSLEVENKVENKNNRTIGIDVGLESFATLSNGEKIENPRYLIKAEENLKKLQRRLNKKKLKSRNRAKARLKLARQHIKVFNSRNDFLHKISRKLVTNYSVIAVEKLNINNMVKNKHLAKHIHDASWNRFIQLLSYKAVTSGGLLIQNTRTRGSSKRCSKCGNIMEMPLSKRIFKCSKCNLVIDRDVNAAINHLNDTAGQAGIYKPVENLLVKKAYETGTTRGESSKIIDAGSSIF